MDAIDISELSPDDLAHLADSPLAEVLSKPDRPKYMSFNAKDFG